MMLRRLMSLGVTLPYAGWRLLWGVGSDSCAVLYFHGVTAAQRESFERHMRWLKAHYAILPLRKLLDNWGGRHVCITFDDGLDNVRKHALPILHELEIPATVFAVAGNLGGAPSWAIDEKHPDRDEILSTADQLSEYAKGLIEIGSHTMSHPDLSLLTGEALRRELADSKSALEAVLGREVLSLSVPFGSYNAETIRVAEQVGYKIVVTCDPVVFQPGSSPLQVGRFKAAPDDWCAEFRLKAAGAHEWRRTWQQLHGASKYQSKVDARPFAAGPEAELSK